MISKIRYDQGVSIQGIFVI